MAKKRHHSPEKEGHNKRPAEDQRESLVVKEAIDALTSGDVTSKVAQKCIQTLQHESRDVGLTSEEIITLIDCIEDGSLNEQIRKRLIPCLLPADHVPNLAVVTAVQYMACPTFPLPIQVEFARWLCAVFEMIESTESLSYLYTVLFSLIDCEAMQPYICELLFKLTTKEHATAMRIRILIDLQSEEACPPYVLLLLQLYATYRPDVVMVHCKYKRAFKSLGQLYTHINKKIATGAAASKKRPSRPPVNVEAMILKKEITKYSDLSDLLSRLQGNLRVSEFLQSPHRRVLFFSNLPETFMVRLYMFMKMALYSETPWVLSNIKYSRNELLTLISSISSELQEGFPVVQIFLAQYLEIWDGQKNAEAVFSLLSQWNICSFDYIKPILDHLFFHFCCSPVEFMCAFLESFTQLYKNWGFFEMPRLLTRKKDAESPQDIKKLMTIFSRYEDEEDVDDPKVEIASLSEYIDKLCCTALQIHSSHPTQLLYQVLNFYRTALVVHQNQMSCPLLLPPVPVMCAVLFTSNPAILSLGCELLLGYRTAISIMKKKSMSSARLSIKTVNYYVSDLCNILVLQVSPESVKDSLFFDKKMYASLASATSNVGECFLLYRHPAMLGLMLTFIKRLQNEPFVENILSDPSTRKSFFRHIRTEGFHGIVKFLSTFIIAYSREST